MGRLNLWCRVVMNEATESEISGLDPSGLDVLEVSGDVWSDFGFRSHEVASYPDFDICKERLPRTFDLIIAEQVFEHVRRPDAAARNVYAMLRAGGTFLISTPFFCRIHPAPLDLWRWTPQGLGAFLEDAGFQDIAVSSWGNRECINANLDEWPEYDPEKHSLVAEPLLPTVIWAFARRL